MLNPDLNTAQGLTSMNTDTNQTGIRTLPPVVVLAALVVAWAVEFFVPTTTGLAFGVRVTVGIYPDRGADRDGRPACSQSFAVPDPAYDVRKIPGQLVTDGAFAYSRNPGYAGLVVACIGFGLAFDNLWVVPAALAAAMIIHYRVILKEEAVLEREFGEAYLDYKARVRRWI